jgi:acyl-CoA dehydrogenase
MSERSLLAGVVEDLFSSRCTPDDVEEFEDGRDPRPLWDEVEELGLTLASVPEEAGGPGGSLIDALTVLRAAGRHAVPLPLAESALLAGRLLAAAGLPIETGPIAVAPIEPGETIRVRRDDSGAHLDGRATKVPWASSADHLVVLADDAGEATVIVLDPRKLKVLPGHNLAGEARDTVELDGIEVAGAPQGVAPIDPDELLLRAALARASMMLGALERTRDLAVSHARDRSQFGRSLSSFQAVQHMLAQIARDVAVTRAAVELAVAAADEDVEGAWLEIASAKVVAGRAAHFVTARAHQVHGAIGITREYSLAAVTRRLWSWREEYGTETYWSRRIGKQAWLADEGVWGLITSGRLPLDTARTA